MFHEDLDTVDVEFQYAMMPAGGHRLLWGAGYRYSRDRVENSAAQAFMPANRVLGWGNLFVQDEIALPSEFELALGAKLERNVYTGSEFLPSARLSRRLSNNGFIWTALSRAVRAPSRIDRELFIPGNPPFFVAGGSNFDSEVANVAEIGYRAQPLPSLSYSITAFYNDFSRLRSLEPMPGGAVFANGIDGRSSGIEAWASYRVTGSWRISGGGVALRERLRVKPGVVDLGGLAALGNDPGAWWQLRSSLDLTPQHEFDISVRHTGPRPNPAVPSYTAVDARLGWRPMRNLEIAATLQNLFDPGHPEWGVASSRAEYKRGFFVDFVWTP
jgi:iron complex outermembrane receptor protein